MSMKIALAGNPNSGKTTLFNDLTGGNQYVGNWPGVTVEKKDGPLKGHKDVTIHTMSHKSSTCTTNNQMSFACNFCFISYFFDKNL